MAKRKAEEDPCKKALNDIIDAWESLRGPRFYSPSDIDKWLRNKMAPEINKARTILRRPILDA